MRSTRPKPLHMICGRAMVMHVIHALEQLRRRPHGRRRRPRRRAGHQEGAGAGARRGPTSRSSSRPMQRGTGDAAMVGHDRASPATTSTTTSTVVVLPGDTPLLRPETLDAARRHPRRQRLRGHAAHQRRSTTRPATAASSARRKTGRPGAAHRRAARRARPRSSTITEVNTSIYAFRRDLLGPALRHLTPDNAQGEYYLTDVIGVLAGMGHRVGARAGARRRRPRASTTAGSSRSPSASCAAAPTATGC